MGPGDSIENDVDGVFARDAHLLARLEEAADNGGMEDDEYFTANDKYLANVASAEKWGVTYNRVNVILRVLFQMIEENTKLGKIQEVSTLLGLVKSMAGGTLDLDGIVTLLGSFGLTGDSLEIGRASCRERV